MIGVVTDLIEDIVASFFETMTKALFGGLFSMVFNIEELIAEVLGEGVLDELMEFLYMVSIILVTIKLLKKGFMIYILWRDGDSENSPLEMITSLGMIVFVLAGFHEMYGWFVEIMMWIHTEISSVIAVANFGDNILYAIEPLINGSIVNIIMLSVFLIQLIILYFSFYKRGAEILVLRLMMPFTVLGLLDSDGGIFKSFMQQLIKAAFTTLIQMFCLNMSLSILFNMHNDTWQALCLSISFLQLANSTPALLNQFMLAIGGGGGMHKVSSTIHTMSYAKKLIGK